MIDAIDIFFCVLGECGGDVSQLPTIKVFVLFIKRFFWYRKDDVWSTANRHEVERIERDKWLRFYNLVTR